MAKTGKILLWLSILLAGFNTAAAQDNWTLKLNKDGIKVYVLNNSNNLQSFKAQTYIRTTPERILTLLRQPNTYNQWIAQVSEAKMVKKYSDNRFVIWYKISMPSGFKDRDVVVENIIHKKSNGEITVQLISRPGAYPVQKSTVRIEKAYGSWTLQPQNGKILVTYEFHSDPKTNIPQWLSDIFMVKKPYQTLKNLRQWTEK